MIPLCLDLGVGLIPWSPLARGLLARPYSEREATTRGESDQFSPRWYAEGAIEEIIAAVGGVAEARGVSRAQVALAWLLSKEAVTAPIVGVTKMSHLDDAVAAVDIELSKEDFAKLEEPYRPRSIAGH